MPFSANAYLYSIRACKNSIKNYLNDLGYKFCSFNYVMKIPTGKMHRVLVITCILRGIYVPAQY